MYVDAGAGAEASLGQGASWVIGRKFRHIWLNESGIATPVWIGRECRVGGVDPIAVWYISN